MGNKSSCYIELSGNKESLEEIEKSIREKNLNPLFVDKERRFNVLFEEDTEELEMEIQDDEVLIISFIGDWCGEYYWFKKVCEFYGLSGTYRDDEEMMDFYHKIVYKDGELVEEIRDYYFCEEMVELYGIDMFFDIYESYFDKEYLDNEEYERVKEMFLKCSDKTEIEIDEMIFE